MALKSISRDADGGRRKKEAGADGVQIKWGNIAQKQVGAQNDDLLLHLACGVSSAIKRGLNVARPKQSYPYRLGKV